MHDMASELPFAFAVVPSAVFLLFLLGIFLVDQLRFVHSCISREGPILHCRDTQDQNARRWHSYPAVMLAVLI